MHRQKQSKVQGIVISLTTTVDVIPATRGISLNSSNSQTLVMPNSKVAHSNQLVTKATTTAAAFFNEFVVRYGFPDRIHSDQGANFESDLIKNLCHLANIEKSRTTSYHPMGNGQCERMNRTLLNMLGTLDPSRKHDWKSAVARLVHAYNSTRHQSTGFTPYYLMFGRHPKLPVDLSLGLSTDPTVSGRTYEDYVNNMKLKLDEAYKLAGQNIGKAQAHQKREYDIKARGGTVQVGDRVLVKVVAFDGKHKIADRWEQEPYVVVEQPIKEIPVYIVKREDGNGLSRTLHRNLLLPIGQLPVTSREVKTGPSRPTIRKDPPQEPTPPPPSNEGTENVSTSDKAEVEASDDEDEFIVIHPHLPLFPYVVLVRKKDQSLRLCVDYRQLNR